MEERKDENKLTIQKTTHQNARNLKISIILFRMLDDDVELRDLLVNNLEASGTLSRIKAELRAAIFSCLGLFFVLCKFLPFLLSVSHNFYCYQLLFSR